MNVQCHDTCWPHGYVHISRLISWAGQGRSWVPGVTTRGREADGGAGYMNFCVPYTFCYLLVIVFYFRHQGQGLWMARELHCLFRGRLVVQHRGGAGAGDAQAGEVAIPVTYCQNSLSGYLTYCTGNHGLQGGDPRALLILLFSSRVYYCNFDR